MCGFLAMRFVYYRETICFYSGQIDIGYPLNLDQKKNLSPHDTCS